MVHVPPYSEKIFENIYQLKEDKEQTYVFCPFGEITNFMFLRVYLIFKLLMVYSKYNNDENFKDVIL